MSTTQQVTASAAGNFPIQVNLAAMRNGSGIGILVTVPAGVTVSYTVNVSGDSQTLKLPINLNPHDTLGSAQSASVNGNIAYPVSWVVLSVASITGGSIILSVIQPPVVTSSF